MNQLVKLYVMFGQSRQFCKRITIISERFLDCVVFLLNFLLFQVL